MKRSLLSILIILTPLLVLFSYEFYRGFYVKNQGGIWVSICDFAFMIHSYHLRDMEKPIPGVDPVERDRILQRLEPGKYREVREMAGWRLSQMPADFVAVHLIERLDPSYDMGLFETAASVLGQLKAREAVPPLIELLETSDKLQVRLKAMKTLGEIGDPRAIDALKEIALHPKTHETRWMSDNERHTALTALAEMGPDGANFILEQFERATDTFDIESMLWPLSRTGNPEAAKILAGLLSYPSYKVRRGAAGGLGRMGPCGVDPALDVLESESNDYIRHLIIEGSLRGNPAARKNPRVVPILKRFLDDFALKEDALRALVWIGTPEAIQVLDESGLPPTEIMRYIEYGGPEAFRLLTHFLKSEDAYVRRKAIYTSVGMGDPRAADLVETLLHDNDRFVRQAAENAILTLDHVHLVESILSYLPETLKREFGSEFRRMLHWGSWGKDEERLLRLLRILHYVGIVFSLLLGLLLMFNATSALEPHRFNLFIIFLLSEGFLGDFLLMNQDFTSYKAGTAVHIVLLLGFFFMRRDHEPGALVGRFERLGGAGLWILAPVLLFIGVPLLMEGLRHCFRGLGFTAAFSILFAVSAFLVFEQSVLPWNLYPRSARVERLITGSLSSGLMILLGTALGRLAEEKWVAGDKDAAVLCVLLFLPFAMMLLFLLYRIRFFKKTGALEPVPPPLGSRLKVSWDQETTTVCVLGFRTWRVLFLAPWGLGFLLPILWMMAEKDAAHGGTGYFIFMMIFPLVGCIITWFIVAGMLNRFIIQFRNGYARCDLTLCGGTLLKSPWRRHLHLAKIPREFSQEERQWFQKLLAGSRGNEGSRLSTIVGREEEPCVS